MVNRMVLGCSLIFFAWHTGCAQYHQALLDILNSPERTVIVQQSIDSFLIINAPKAPDIELADIYHDLGSKWYYQLWLNDERHSNLERAIEVTEQALSIKRRIALPESCSLNKTLYNFAYFKFLDNRVFEAIDLYWEIIRNGEQYCRDPSKDNKVNWARRSLGDLYIEMGDFYRALDIYSGLVGSLESNGQLNVLQLEDMTWAYIKRAEIYSLMNSVHYSAEILENLEHARAYLRQGNIPCCFYENRINQWQGNLMLDLQRFEEASPYHRLVLKGLEPDDSVNMANALNSIAYSFVKQELYDSAQVNIQKAIAFNPMYPAPYNNLGDIFLDKEQFTQALSEYQKAIDLTIDPAVKKDFDGLPSLAELTLVPQKIPLLNHILTKANGWMAFYHFDGDKKHLTHALETFALADQLVGLIRFEGMEQQSKFYWREAGASLYLNAVETAYLLGQPERAYYFMERNKAMLLMEDITHHEAMQIAKLPESIANREFELRRQIYLQENRMINSDRSDDRLSDSLRQEIMDLKYAHTHFIDSLNIAYPGYARYKEKLTTLPYAKMRSDYISADRAVLHYILNEEKGFGLLNTHEGAELFQIPDAGKFNREIREFISLASNSLSRWETYRSLSRELFSQLFPANTYGRIAGRQLLIVPDYNLQRIPFEAIVMPETGKYLLEELEIRYAYSISLLNQTEQWSSNAPGAFLGLAPVRFGKQTLVDLPQSEAEVLSIQPLFGGALLMGEQASKANFLKEVSNYRMVHLSTHADLGNGDNPWVAFSDAKMFLNEIYATKSQSEMIVLSSCNTANGDLKPGEGVMSLARGFFYSGAKAIVSSLWPAEDAATRYIMVEFYKNLKQGDAKSKALQKAKRSYLEATDIAELRHPFYWAGFVILGDNAPVADSVHVFWIISAIAATALLLMILSPKARNFFKKRLRFLSFITGV